MATRWITSCRRERCALSQFGQQKNSLARIGVVQQLALITVQEDLPYAIQIALRLLLFSQPAQQFLAGCEGRQPHVEVVLAGVVFFLHAARQIAHDADAQPL
jgi:hypothetical protein